MLFSRRIPPLTKCKNYSRRVPEPLFTSTVEKQLEASQESSSEDSDDASVQSGLKRKVKLDIYCKLLISIAMLVFVFLCYLHKPVAIFTSDSFQYIHVLIFSMNRSPCVEFLF